MRIRMYLANLAVIAATFASGAGAQSLEDTAQWLEAYLSKRDNHFTWVFREGYEQSVRFPERCTMEVSHRYLAERRGETLVYTVPLGELTPTVTLYRTGSGVVLLRLRTQMLRERIRVGAGHLHTMSIAPPEFDEDHGRAVQALQRVIRMCGGRPDPA